MKFVVFTSVICLLCDPTHFKKAEAPNLDSYKRKINSFYHAIPQNIDFAEKSTGKLEPGPEVHGTPGT